MSAKEYKVRPPITNSKKDVLQGYLPIVQHLLVHRGIHSSDDAEMFLNPSFEDHTHDPYLLHDMEKAVERILAAISKEEKIGIFSDYDADGIPGGVLLSDFFDMIKYTHVRNYIPDRHTEGFGLNEEALSELKEEGVTLLITVDCGIADVECVNYANTLGMDVIITDHHEPGEVLPDAHAIINPKHPSCKYPEKMLCGSGVAYKLVEGILEKDRFTLPKGHEKWLLDLVGIATISDMVPLTGENRVLAHYGLKVLRKSRRPGLTALLRKVRVHKYSLSEDDIGFTIAPRINAASRMGHPMDGFLLLKTKDMQEAEMAALHLEKINNERKGVVASLVKEIKKRVHERELARDPRPVIAMGDPEWRPALLGLAANSISEQFNRPVFLWGRDGETFKGSCRSDGVTDLIALMGEATEAFIQFGGHKLAGGFTVFKDTIHSFEDIVVKAYERSVEGASAKKEIEWVDASLGVKDISWELWNHLTPLAPFGMGNEKPVFLLEDVYVDAVRMFGKEKNHLELVVKDSEGCSVKAIAFFSSADSFTFPLSEGVKCSLVANVEKNTFGRSPELRLRIIDIISS